MKEDAALLAAGLAGGLPLPVAQRTCLPVCRVRPSPESPAGTVNGRVSGTGGAARNPGSCVAGAGAMLGGAAATATRTGHSGWRRSMAACRRLVTWRALLRERASCSPESTARPIRPTPRYRRLPTDSSNDTTQPWLRGAGIYSSVIASHAASIASPHVASIRRRFREAEKRVSLSSSWRWSSRSVHGSVFRSMSTTASLLAVRLWPERGRQTNHVGSSEHVVQARFPRYPQGDRGRQWRCKCALGRKEGKRPSAHSAAPNQAAAVRHSNAAANSSEQ